MSLRLDRFASLYVVAPLKRLASKGQASIPILMYHSIADEDESGMHPYYRTATSPAAFVVQMEYLHRSGYRTCSLAEATDILESPTGTRLKHVAVTFDDGYGNFYREAFPVLQRFNFAATMFLPTEFIGENARHFKGRDCLTWAEVRELQRYGISFGSHTVSHPQLHSLGRDAIELELAHSKKTIEDKTGRIVESFAYPYAFPQTDTTFKNLLRESLRRAGYKNGVCTIVGRAGSHSDPFFMERLPVNNSDDAALLHAKLTGAYDWIGRSQSLIQNARALGKRIRGRS